MSTKKFPLQKIANIRFGTSVTTLDDGSIPCLQVSNLTASGNLDTELLVFLSQKSVDEDDLLKNGDLLMPAKGRRFQTVLVPDSYDSIAAASSSLFVIRVTNKQILPEYLKWFLNLPRIQWDLANEATGTNIASLSIKYLRKLYIEIPDLSIQKQIIDMINLQKYEEQILFELTEQRKKLFKALTNNLINP